MAEQEARNEFDAAVAAVSAAPDDFASWDQVELLAEELNCPDEVAQLYKTILARNLPKELANELGERAAGFAEEWFGDDQSVLRGVLNRVLVLDPGADWAFQRLTELFTVGERWNDLLELYDNALKATDDDDRRIQLLDEAAQVAKDIANQPDKAIGYLQRLIPLKPDDAQLEHSLERLLERYERWVDLIRLWESKLPSLPAEERDQSRVRIAECWLDRLAEPGNALEAVRPLLAEGSDDRYGACALLERIVTFEGASNQVRNSALDMLRLHYEATERPREIVRVLEAAISMASAEDSQPLREEAATRLAALEEDVAAMDHFAALLALRPSHPTAQEQMFELARRSGEFARYAEGIARAAQAATHTPRKVALLAEAARIRLDMLADETGAIELYKAALAQEGLPEDEEPLVARRLAELLARADRQAERLGVLERLAAIDKSPASRRTVIGEAARLAESLGETDRALKLWQTRIDDDGDDIFAIDAIIALLESNRRWGPLIESLSQRVAKATSESQRRADLIHIATIYDRQLEDLNKAIEAWVRVQTECGESTETVDALADLFARTERWSDLAELLERASGREIARVTTRLSRLSDAYRSHLGAPDRALAGYRNALAIDSTYEPALVGMAGLLDMEDCRASASTALAQAYRNNEQWSRFMELTEPRLLTAKDARERLDVLREAAEIAEDRLGDKAAALSAWARAFPLAPKNQVLEGHVLRLAEATGDFAQAAKAYEQSIGALVGEPHEVARLRMSLGEILDGRLGQQEDAHRAFFAVLGTQPGNLDAARVLVRLGTRLGHWDDVAAAVLGYVRERRAIDEGLIAEVEKVAAEQDSFAQAANAFYGQLQGGKPLPPHLAFALYRTVALWYRDHLGDSARAAQALTSALSFDGSRADALRDLAGLLRATPGRELFSTLRRLADVDPGDLDVQREAAEVATQHLKSPEDERVALTSLLGRATAVWRGTAQGQGAEPAESYVAWAIDKLVAHHLGAGNAAAAFDLLVDSSRLPFAAQTRRAMRYQAAAIASDKLRDNAAAIEMYRSVLSQVPDDTEAMDRLADLYETEGRVAEKLSLRRMQLGLVKDPEDRLRLRLEIANLVGEIERTGGRMEALRANLEDSPGHEASVDALYRILSSQGAYAELATLLEEQAKKLQERDEARRAALLWSRAARVAETETGEIDRAIRDYRRVVDLAPTAESLNALATLYVQRGQPAMAVPWFENLLGTAVPSERSGIVLSLARAHLAAKQVDRAILCLEENLPANAPAPELRSLLVSLYRDAKRWEPLARLLTDSLPLLSDREQVIAYAREAAELYSGVLESPNRAIPALEKALALMPDDRAMRLQLAVGLRVAGRLDEAKQLLNAIIEEFGRRRTAERAAVHVELAWVSQAQGDLNEALEQMELASKMDSGNVEIQRQLAELARKSGNLDKAERTFRALLLAVRRKQPGDDAGAVGVSEVLYELHTLAAERGQAEQAKELLESAIETAEQSDVEVRRLRRSLLAHGQAETLLQVLRRRLEASSEAISQAALLADISRVLDENLGRPGEALTTMLQAMTKQPMRDDLYERGRELSKRAGNVKVYAEAVVEIADKLRRKEDPPLVASLLLRAGEVLEYDAGDHRGALALYKRAEETGERKAEAYYAIARVTGELGDTAEQARVLEAMLAMATADETSPAQIDALYRLAEIFVTSDARREQGIDLLQQAFEAEPRYGQAGKSLKIAAAADPDNERVMTLYERVARTGSDWNLLLDFLERRADRPGATAAEIREAADLAVQYSQNDRAEALLSRAVEAARSSREGLGSAIWAAIGLAERRAEAGDLRASQSLIYEVAGYANPEQLQTLCLRIGSMARFKDPALAAEIYEFLREREPSNRQIWSPLVELYRDLGDGDKLQAVIGATLPTLTDPAERNALRMEQARYLLEKLGRTEAAIEILRDVLLDQPDHVQASDMLENVLREQGDQDALVDFLWQRFEDVKERGSVDAVIAMARRLGAMLDGMGSADAVNVYRAALELAPESRELLQAVLDHLGPEADLSERAQLIERLIAAEEPANAAKLAAELVTVYESLGDSEGVQRTLELGHRANPGDAALHQRLETWYRDNQKWAELAEMMTSDARVTAQDPGKAELAVARLREAASVYRDTLGDTRAAASVLAEARRLTPGNDALVGELAACLSAGGDIGGAIAAITEALTDSDAISGNARVELLLLRAGLRGQLGQDPLEDLKEAYAIDAERIRPTLISAVDAQRTSAAERGDRDTERAATTQLIGLLGEAGDQDQRRALLVSWVEREPSDREPLYMLRDMDRAIEHWDGVLAVCARLVHLETGEPQVQAALSLAEAAEMAGRPSDALAGLEAVHHAQPQSELVRSRLRRLYELSGAYRELAAVLLADGEHATDEEGRYQAYRRAAEVLVYSLHDPAAAIVPARKAQELRPEDNDATVLYVDILVASGQTEQAIAVLEPAINAQRRRTPQLASLQQRMARVAAMVGDRTNQLEWLKRAFDVDRKNGEIAAELAQLATEMGDYELALKPLRAITLMENPGPITRVMALLWEAKIEHARGNKAKAELWAKKALREDPNFAEAQEFLDQIAE